MYSTKIPILILGFNRTGTTFLGNCLQHFFDIATVSDQIHYGILESTIYSHKKYFGNISSLDDFIEFVQIYSGTDFVKYSGMTQDQLLNFRERDFYSFFLTMMDNVADINNKKYWVTKLDPNFFFDNKEFNLFINTLNRRYKIIKYVSISRELTSYLNSKSKQNNYFKNSFLSNIFNIALYTHTYTKINSFSKVTKILFLDYHELKTNTVKQLNIISQFLEIQLLNSGPYNYLVNSSFNDNLYNISKSNTTKHHTYKLLNKSIILIYKIYNKFKKPRSPLYWRFIKLKYFKQELMHELESSNNKALFEILNKNS